MKCFLHIGTEKTATTTIQNFFDLNRDNLLKNGFIYTQSVGAKNNRALSAAAYNLDRRDDFTKINCLNSDNELHGFQKNIIDQLSNEIEATSKNREKLKIIFSSEHFQSRLTTVEEISRLKTILYSFGITEVVVLVYLRRPSDIANSLYSTAIKAGNTIKLPPAPEKPYFNNVCNHKKTLENFGSVFGKSSIIPRLFEKNEFKNNSIIDDVIHQIGITNKNNGSYKIPEDLNKGLSTTGINLLRHLNKIVPAWINDKPNPTRGKLVSTIESSFSNESYMMPSFLYEEYDSFFKESDEWVRENYFPERKVLFCENRQRNDISPVPEVELIRMANFIGKIWNNDKA